METGQPPELRARAGAPITRRAFVVAAAAGLAVSCNRRHEVILGVQSYSFRDRPLDDAIAGMQKLGLHSCELWQSHIEPRNIPRDEMRRWRETIELDMFHRVREKFEKASIAVSAYNISFKDDFSDTEIERGFEMADALGTDVITASSNVKTVARIAPVAERHEMYVGMHNHSNPDPNEFASAESLTGALAHGEFIAVNLDIGHFTAANGDATAFLNQHYDRIVTLHLKDRKRDQGPTVPFGEGDAPIVSVLKLLQENGWGFPANIEYEYKGGDSVEEVGKCLDYCRRALEL